VAAAVTRSCAARISADELLAVETDHVARALALVAHDRLFRLGRGEAEPEAAQHETRAYDRRQVTTRTRRAADV
jgi:hypothetical protein